jgi:hypothetical protein
VAFSSKPSYTNLLPRLSRNLRTPKLEGELKHHGCRLFRSCLVFGIFLWTRECEIRRLARWSISKYQWSTDPPNFAKISKSSHVAQEDGFDSLV